MRKLYIDNLRSLCILLLFPFHTCMIYNNWGEAFYVTSTPRFSTSLFVVLVFPWWMTLLFVLAGMSARYALESRTDRQFIKERMQKLFIPLLSGAVLILPVQSYIADVYYNGYSGNYFMHYQVFFGKITDFSGKDGGFTPGHLWFILYLWIVSMVTLPLIRKLRHGKPMINIKNLSAWKLFLLFLPIMICTPLLDIGGKSIGEYGACYLIGFYFVSYESVQDLITKKKIIFAVILAQSQILWDKGFLT